MKEPNENLKEVLEQAYKAIESAIDNPQADKNTICELLDDAIETASNYEQGHEVRMGWYYQRLDRMLDRYKDRFGEDAR